MAFQTIFQRYELKFMLTEEQRQRLLAHVEPYMKLDKYGHSTIRNIYFDTPSYLLIRRSIEKPAYKEKLRIRSYTQVGHEDTVFVELKKKYRSVVYKRRIDLPEQEAMDWTCGRAPCTKQTQITREIDYVLSYYEGLAPAVFLSYEREAFKERGGGDFRMTVDENILYRTEDLSLCSDVYGTPILPEGHVLLELKCSGGLPFWMLEFLSKEKIYKTSFSKYGTAYRMIHAQKLAKIDKEKDKEKVL